MHSGRYCWRADWFDPHALRRQSRRFLDSCNPLRNPRRLHQGVGLRRPSVLRSQWPDRVGNSFRLRFQGQVRRPLGRRPLLVLRSQPLQCPEIRFLHVARWRWRTFVAGSIRRGPRWRSHSRFEESVVRAFRLQLASDQLNLILEYGIGNTDPRKTHTHWSCSFV